MRVLAGFTAVLVLTFATACGGGGGTTTTQAPGQQPGGSGAGPGLTNAPLQTTSSGEAAVTCTPGAATDGQTLSMSGSHEVSPADAAIKTGESVTWTNNSKQNHKIKITNGPDCGFTLIGKSVSAKFAAAGTYSWLCTIHPTYMKGTITVS